MRILDFFRSSEKQLSKTIKRATETAGEDGPRLDALDKLAEWGTEEALDGLLRRFTVSSKVLTQDIEEKRMVVRLLVAKGQGAVPAIMRFMRKNHHVDWPVQALDQILTRDEVARTLAAVLEDVSRDEFSSPQHRVSLLRAMKGHLTLETSGLAQSLLQDTDDDVRLATIDALMELGEAIRDPLLEAFVESADRPRVRIRIAEVFAEQGWNVKGYRPTVEENLPEGFTVNAKGLIKRK